MPLTMIQDRAKKDFVTRLSRETLTRLDQLVQSGRFKTRKRVTRKRVCRRASGRAASPAHRTCG